VLIENEINEKKNRKLREDEENRRREDLHLQREQNALKPSDLDKLFKITDNLLLKLTPGELLRLSELQLELEKCRSEFAVSQTIGNSEFFKKLSDNRKRELRNENELLF
jgi:hypothetical protein